MNSDSSFSSTDSSDEDNHVNTTSSHSNSNSNQDLSLNVPEIETYLINTTEIEPGIRIITQAGTTSEGNFVL